MFIDDYFLKSLMEKQNIYYETIKIDIGAKPSSATLYMSKVV